MYNQPKDKASNFRAATMVWLFALAAVNVGALIFAVVVFTPAYVFALPVFVVASGACSVPSWVILLLLIGTIEASRWDYPTKLFWLHVLFVFISLLYAVFLFVLTFLFRENYAGDYLDSSFVAGALYVAWLISALINRKMLRRYLGYKALHAQYSSHQPYSSISNIINMEQNPPFERTANAYTPVRHSNKILIKSIITAVLIVVMAVPSTFIQNLISERQDRQQEVVNEVSSKWAQPQTLSAPYLVIPYLEGQAKTLKQLIILPEQLNVKGNIAEESRQRSIYKVLLYTSKLNFTGNFHPKTGLNDSDVLLPNDAKLCFGLSDFRGIEGKVSVQLNNENLDLLPGLPVQNIDSTGLSAPVNITADDLNKGINFNLAISVRGSGYLHFVPISPSCNFNIESVWPSPSFDGNTLPSEHDISGHGFAANWNFSAANVPFTSVIRNGNVNTKDIVFGVSLVQPADQYVQSMRSAKYAILVIALTFAVFFISEILQKKPVHPVQYILIGLALVIFYTLLLSISEFILFGYAYLIAAGATIILIALYAKAHFKTIRSALAFGTLLSVLYSFIYVLISLEDTALLIGSIALFIVIAIIMYVTRKIQWYQTEPIPVLNIQP